MLRSVSLLKPGLQFIKLRNSLFVSTGKLIRDKT